MRFTWIRLNPGGKHVTLGTLVAEDDHHDTPTSMK
jgi:hypothetical protein